MSRKLTIGTNPKTKEIVDVAYGYDCVPGLPEGYFFQVFSRNKKEIEKCPTGEGILVNEGFVAGISKGKLNELFKKWSAIT